MGGTCSIQTTYGFGVVDIFVKGIAWVAEPLRGLGYQKQLHVHMCYQLYALLYFPLRANHLVRLLWTGSPCSPPERVLVPNTDVESTVKTGPLLG